MWHSKCAWNAGARCDRQPGRGAGKWEFLLRISFTWEARSQVHSNNNNSIHSTYQSLLVLYITTQQNLYNDYSCHRIHLLDAQHVPASVSSAYTNSPLYSTTVQDEYFNSHFKDKATERLQSKWSNVTLLESSKLNRNSVHMIPQIYIRDQEQNRSCNSMGVKGVSP